MTDEPYAICYLVEDLTEDSVQSLVRGCIDAGFDLRDERNHSELPPADTYIDGERGRIDLQYDDVTDVTLYLNVGEEWAWNDPRVQVSFSTMPLDTDVNVNPEEHTRETVQRRADAIVDLATRITGIVDPTYAWGMLSVGPEPDDGFRPLSRPISESISKLSWITVLSEPTVEDLGGRDRVLDAPAWHVEELEMGHVVIVGSDNPVDPTERPPESLEAYLLDGADADDSPSDKRS